MDDTDNNVVQLQLQLAPPPPRIMEHVPDAMLMYLHEALTNEGNIFVPRRYDTEAGRAYCVGFYTDLMQEIELRDIDTETGTRIEYITHDLLPR